VGNALAGFERLYPRGRFEGASGFIVMEQERLHFAPQAFVAAAFFREEGGAPGGLEALGRFEQALNLSPPLRVHATPPYSVRVPAISQDYFTGPR